MQFTSHLRKGLQNIRFPSHPQRSLPLPINISFGFTIAIAIETTHSLETVSD